MPLRVLLADESPTIKKVIQISLQDFAVDLKTVQLGIDVLQVTKQFQPDIIFADVLLQKRNGYETTSDLKNDPTTKHIPVILMWSGFMDLDEAKFKESRADAQLEKPFDADTIRALVKKLVQKTQSHTLSNYLEFPTLTFQEDEGQDSQQEHSSETHVQEDGLRDSNDELPYEANATSESNSNTWNMDSFEDIDQFRSNMGALESDEENAENSEPHEADEFQRRPIQALGKQLDRNESETQKPSAPSSTSAGSTSNSHAHEYNDKAVTRAELLASVAIVGKQNEPTSVRVTETTDKKETQSYLNKNPELTVPQLTEEELKKIIQGQSREIVEKVVWQVVPEIATKLIQQELRRLLDEPKL